MNKEERLNGEKFLNQWAYLKCELRKIEDEIYNIQSNSKSYEFNNGNCFVETFNKDFYVKSLNEMLQNFQKNFIKYKFIDNILMDLEEHQKLVIKLRYEKNHSWDAIALKSHMSRRTCFNVKNMVIKKILMYLKFI